MSKISHKTDTFLLNYSYLFWGPLFYRTQCGITLAVCGFAFQMVVNHIVIQNAC